MLLAGLGFAIMGAFVKAGAARFTTSELVFYRSAFGFLMIAALVCWQGKPLKTPLLATQMRRAGVGFTALLLFFTPLPIYRWPLPLPSITPHPCF